MSVDFVANELEASLFLEGEWIVVFSHSEYSAEYVFSEFGVKVLQVRCE